MTNSVSRLLDLPLSTSQKQKQFLLWLKNGDFNEFEGVVNDTLNPLEEKLVKNWLTTALQNTAKSQNLTTLTYLLTSPNLLHHARINTKCWTIACSKGNMAMVKFLAASPLLKTHVALDAKNNYALSAAIAFSNKELLNYLLSPDNKSLWSEPYALVRKLPRTVVFAAAIEKWEILEHLLSHENVNVLPIKDELTKFENFLNKEQTLALIEVVIEKKTINAAIAPLDTIAPKQKTLKI